MKVIFTAIGSNCFVNGSKIGSDLEIKHDDRLVIGLKYVFKFQFPNLNSAQITQEGAKERITWQTVKQELKDVSGINLKRNFERAQSTDREEVKNLLVKYKEKIGELENERNSLKNEKEELMKKYESQVNYQKTMESMYKKEIDSKEERYKDEIRQYEDALMELQTQLNELDDDSRSSLSISLSNQDESENSRITEENMQMMVDAFHQWKNYQIRKLRDTLREFESLVGEANRISRECDKQMEFKLKVTSDSLYTSVPSEAQSGW